MLLPLHTANSHFYVLATNALHKLTLSETL